VLIVQNKGRHQRTSKKFCAQGVNGHMINSLHAVQTW